MKEIILVGTIHIDTKGPERLKKILEKESPDIITIESTEDILNHATEIHKYISKNRLILKYSTRRIRFTPFTQQEIAKFEKETIMNVFLSMYFEIIIAKEYAEKHNLKLIHVDKKEYIDQIPTKSSSNLNRKVLFHFERIDKELFKLYPENFQKFVDEIYDNGNKKEKITKEDPSNLLKRNKHAIKKILELGAKKILHIGGMGHIFNNSPNMYEILREKGINVKRFKLIEADNIS